MDKDKDAWLDEVKQWVFGDQLPAHMRPVPVHGNVPAPVVPPVQTERVDSAARAA